MRKKLGGGSRCNETIFWPKVDHTGACLSNQIIRQTFFTLPRSPLIWKKRLVVLKVMMFVLGNGQTLKTLPLQRGIDIHARLREFYNNAYSSHYMTLAVHSRGMLDHNTAVNLFFYL